MTLDVLQTMSSESADEIKHQNKGGNCLRLCIDLVERKSFAHCRSLSFVSVCEKENPEADVQLGLFMPRIQRWTVRIIFAMNMEVTQSHLFANLRKKETLLSGT